MPLNARSDAAATPSALICAAVRAREWDFVEGLLPTPERVSIQMHLDGCESCRREMTLCRNMEGVLLAASAEIPPVGDLRPDFYNRLAAQQRRPHRYGRPLALSALAVGVLAVALIRPAVQSLFAPHVGPVRSTVVVTTAPPRLDAMLPRLGPTESPKLREFHSVPGLTTTEPNLSLAFVDAKSFTQRRHRAARNRRTTPLHLAGVERLVRRPSAKVALMMDGDRRDRYYAYIIPSGQQAERTNTLSKEAPRVSDGYMDLQVSAAVAEAATRDSAVGSDQIAAAMPVEAGFSLEVTDQVRGFSNTTRVASDMEVHGESSTIHLEADGN